MTTLKRLIIILAAALAIVAGTVGLSRTGLLALPGGEFRRGPEGGFRLPPGADGFKFDGRHDAGHENGFEGDHRPGFGGEHRPGGRFEGGLFAVGGVLKNLLIVAVIIAAVVLGSLGLNRIRRGRRPAPPPAAPAGG